MNLALGIILFATLILASTGRNWRRAHRKRLAGNENSGNNCAQRRDPCTSSSDCCPNLVCEVDFFNPSSRNCYSVDFANNIPQIDPGIPGGYQISAGLLESNPSMSQDPPAPNVEIPPAPFRQHSRQDEHSQAPPTEAA